MSRQHSPTIRYTTIPIVLFEIQSYVYLQPLQSQVLNFLIGESLNVYQDKKPITARKWVPFQTSMFAQERGHTRDGVKKAVNALLKIGLIECQWTIIQTNSGAQKGRFLRIVSQEKLEQILVTETAAIRRSGGYSDYSPENVDNSVGGYQDYSPGIARVSTLDGQAIHLGYPDYSPWGVTPPKSLKNFRRKYSLKTLKEFINTFREFRHSFIELYFEKKMSKAERAKLPTEIGALIRRYSVFKVYIAMSVNLFDESADLGNLQALNTFLESNKKKLDEQEHHLQEQCDKIFIRLTELKSELFERLAKQDLEILNQNFKASAGALLAKSELDEQGSSRSIFFYSSFQSDVLNFFIENSFSMNAFTAAVMKKLNIYFQFKILGMKEGLNFVQSPEDNF